MSKKIFFLLFFIFAAFTVIYFLNNKPDSHNNGPFFPGLSEAGAEKIEIDYFTQGITLSKDQNKWMVFERPTKLAEQINTEAKDKIKTDNLITKSGEPSEANSEAMTAALNALIGLQRETLISSNPEKQGLFEVTKAGLTVTVTQKNTPGKSIIIGKAGPTPYSTYVRLADENNVYLVSMELASFFNKPLGEWKQQEQKK